MRTSLSLLASLAFGFLLMNPPSSRAGEVVSFPKDAPDFTFELPDSMQFSYEDKGNLVCTAKDPSVSLKGVFQPVANIKNDRSLLLGLNPMPFGNLE